MVVLTALSDGVVHAQAPAPAAAPAPAVPAVERLTSPDWEVREAATRELMADETLTPERLTEMHAAATSPEQSERLMSAARHHLLRRIIRERFPDRGPGAIGVRMEGQPARLRPDLGRASVGVVQTLPGFPGYAALEPGDLVLAINDNPIPDAASGLEVSDNFKSLITNIAAGRTANLTIHRRGETKVVSVRLVSGEALMAIYIEMASPIALESPFREEWQALRERMLQGSASPPPLTVDLPEAVESSLAAPGEPGPDDVELQIIE